jgi:exodeoxyribonuclease V alpha subunit
MITSSWNEYREVKNIMIYLQGHNVSAVHAAKIYKAYGNESIKIITENPYKLADDIYGIGFKTADAIAQNLGIDKERYIRCRSGILYTLNELSNDGHCYCEIFELARIASEMLDIEEPKLIMSISNMFHENELIKEKTADGELTYLPAFYHCEAGVARLIRKIISAPRLKPIKNMSINSNIEYAEKQKEAVLKCASSKFMVLTGGPGTGKTTTLNGMIELLRNNGLTVLLAAPTGRAAKRMTESTGIEAKTIHRLLEYKPPNGYQKNEKYPLEGDALIIDESSMLDVVLAYNLLKAVPAHMSVIFIGDTNQLPSVERVTFCVILLKAAASP